MVTLKDYFLALHSRVTPRRLGGLDGVPEMEPGGLHAKQVPWPVHSLQPPKRQILIVMKKQKRARDFHGKAHGLHAGEFGSVLHIAKLWKQVVEKTKMFHVGWGVVEHLPGINKDLGLIPRTAKKRKRKEVVLER